jgi:hypothetical protein
MKISLIGENGVRIKFAYFLAVIRFKQKIRSQINMDGIGKNPLTLLSL